MPSNPCPCCGHDNPADATFCCACGVQVTLLPCPSCGAVNDNVATNCYQCERPLPGRAKELPDTVPPAAKGIRARLALHFASGGQRLGSRNDGRAGVLRLYAIFNPCPCPATNGRQ